MKKVIPKIPKSKGLFKNLPWFDMAYLFIIGAICLILLLSNFGVVKYIIFAILAALAGISEIRSDGVSIAHVLYYRLSAATKPKKYLRSDVNGADTCEKVEQLHNVERIEAGVIYYRTGVMARLVEIPDVAFVLKDESRQDRYEDSFGRCFNIIEPYKNVTFIKTEREIDYTEFIENLDRRKSAIKGNETLSHREKTARLEILEHKIEQFKNMERCTFVPVYHLVLRAANLEELDTLTDQIIAELAAGDIMAYAATTANAARALAAQYFSEPVFTESAETIYGAEILPKKISVGAKCIDIDGKKVSTYSICSLPGSVSNAWIAELCAQPNVNVAINVAHVNAHKLIRRIDRVYFETGSEAEQTAKLSESVVKNSQQNSMENLIEDVEYAQDKLCEIEILISFLNSGIESEKDINKYIMDLKMKRNLNKYLQLENFVNTLVGCYNKPLKRNKLVFTTKLLGMAFPMIMPNILEAEGDYIGENDCGVPIIVDWNARDGLLRVNSNMCVFGKSGGGKSFFLKLLLLLRAASGDACIVIDVESEFVPIAEYLGGTVIDMSSGEFRINPLQPFSISEDGKNSVSDHILVVEEFFRVLFPDISLEQRILLREQLAGLYNSWGISDNEDIRKIPSDNFPVILDLFEYLDRNLQREHDEYIKEAMIKLRLLLRSLLSGATGKLWNGHSVLRVGGNFTVFNVQTLLASGNLDVVNAQMKLLSRYINTQLIENYKRISSGGRYRRIIVLMDEVHRLLSPEMTVTIDLCAWLAKQCRKYEAALITASQSVIDMIATEKLKSKTKAVLTESQTNILFGAKSTHIDDIASVYSHANLSHQELDLIKEAARGQGLFMFSDIMRMRAQVTTNELEYSMCARKIDQI